ncbi:coenzyme F420 hydrogenase/dehydrogenase beta subunit N-terminal domain-containing protein, partial [Chloroflexota bacterium]
MEKKRPSVKNWEQNTFDQLNSEVVQVGLCTHCGTCAGLAPDHLYMEQTAWGPLPSSKTNTKVKLPPMIFDVCPGVGVKYSALNKVIFGKYPENWLAGCFENFYIGFSNTPKIRRQGASGGVITQALLFLLDEGLIDGAVVLRHGWPKPWLSSPIIANTKSEIIAASQSVYIPTPVNTILTEMEAFDGRLAYVGLPDQVASLRVLQTLGHPGALKVDYVLGPYVGTSIYLDAIKSYLISNGFNGLEDIKELRYREGEWPGYLQIKTKSGEVLRASKFYYNYLIP